MILPNWHSLRCFLSLSLSLYFEGWKHVVNAIKSLETFAFTVSESFISTKLILSVKWRQIVHAAVDKR